MTRRKYVVKSSKSDTSSSAPGDELTDDHGDVSSETCDSLHSAKLFQWKEWYMLFAFHAPCHSVKNPVFRP